MLMRYPLILTLAACLGACGSDASSDGVGGVSASEASALNNAAAMLDRQAGAAQASDAGLNPAATSAAHADRKRLPPDGTTAGNASRP